MFLDASAMTSMIVGEDDAPALADRLAAADVRARTSPLAIFETALAIVRRHRCTTAEALDKIDAFLDISGVLLVDIPPEAARLALDAHARYGKGTGHPAQLNMGDCFAYACAKAHGVALLYKGDDFARTDLA